MKLQNRKHMVAVAIFMVTLALDIITKYLVETNIARGERIDVMGSFVQLTLLYNDGGVFGILRGHQTFFLIVSIIVFILLVGFYILEPRKTWLFTVAMSLVFSGAIGNILDRISGKPGVVDFIYIGSDSVFRWPAFNVADSVIVMGATMLIINVIFEYNEEKRMKKEQGNEQG